METPSAAAAWSETSRYFPPSHRLLPLLWTRQRHRDYSLCLDCIKEWFDFLLHTNWTAWFPCWDNRRPTESFFFTPPPSPPPYLTMVHCLLLEVSDAEMQVRGDGGQTLLSSGCAAVTLMFLLTAEYFNQHLAAGDVLDTNNEQWWLAFPFMVPGKHPACASLPVPTVHELLLCNLIIFKANWKNFSWLTLKNQCVFWYRNRRGCARCFLWISVLSADLYFSLLAPDTKCTIVSLKMSQIVLNNYLPDGNK